MSRVRLVVSAVLVAVCAVTGAATAAPTHTQQGDFALLLAPGGAGPGNHLAGPGVDGKWAGWTLSIDYGESSDCWNDCWVFALNWRLSSGRNAVWGTCAQDEFGYCRGTYINDPSGTAQLPVTITGGSGRYAGATGTGLVTGPTGSALFVPCCPDPVAAAAVVRLQLTIG